MNQQEVTKSQPVSKLMVWKAYKGVKRNGGSAGIDKQSIAMFDEKQSKNLYKIWNRMSSGSYFPPPVRTVLIPKANGSKRALGIPTVSDRIAQMVVKNHLEPMVDKEFSNQSYGYRPGRSAHDAVKQAEVNCRKYGWVIDLDIKGFFDNLNHEKMMQLLKVHTQEQWILLYVERWLKAGVEMDGEITGRQAGTPQGGVASPLLANIYLHHAFDRWMEESNKRNPFERYADDIIVHCSSSEEAEALLASIRERLREYDLTLHPEKTKIVHCKNYLRNKVEEDGVGFTFLGFDFKPRVAKSKRGGWFLGYGAAIGKSAQSRITAAVKESGLIRWTNATIESIAERWNARIRGWINYYGRFGRKELYKVYDMFNMRLARWIGNKYKITGKRACIKRLKIMKQENKNLFAHWS
jgi:group II intron reverse transcriptase/maturase